MNVRKNYNIFVLSIVFHLNFSIFNFSITFNVIVTFFNFHYFLTFAFWVQVQSILIEIWNVGNFSWPTIAIIYLFIIYYHSKTFQITLELEDICSQVILVGGAKTWGQNILLKNVGLLYSK